MRRHLSPFALPAVLLANVLILGCTEIGYDNTTTSRGPSHDPDADRARRASIERAGARAGAAERTGSDRTADRAIARERTGPVRGDTTFDRTNPRYSSTADRQVGGNSLAFPTGDRRTSALLLEADAPQEVRVGQAYNYTLRVTNLTDVPLHNVRVRDMSDVEMDGDVERRAMDRGDDAARPAAAQVSPVAPAPAAPAERPRDDTAPRDETRRDETTPRDEARRDEARRNEARPDDSARRDERRDARAARRAAPSWNVGTLAPRETKTRQFSATAEEVGSLSNCLTASYSPTLCLAVNVVKPQLHITKTAPERALLCEDITYTYKVTNTGTGTARNVRVEETLPEGLATAQGDRRSLTLEVGDLGAGQSREVSARLRATRTGEFAGRAVARAADAADLEARSPDTTTVVREPVLAIDVTSPEARYVGEPVEYRVTVRNTGDADAKNTVVKLSAQGATERLQDRDLGNIEPGKSKDFTITTRAGREAGNIQLTATASATCARQASDSSSVAIRTAPALQIECVDGQDPIRVGANTTYTITVKNEGTGPDTNVTIRATLPPELQYVGARDRNADVKLEGQTLTFGPVRTLAPGANATWTIEAKAVQAGDIRFGLELTSDSLTKPAVETEPTRIVGEDRAAPERAAPERAAPERREERPAERIERTNETRPNTTDNK